MTLRELLETRVRESGEKPYLYFEKEVLSYKEFDKRVNQTAHALKSVGVEFGTKVCIHLTNCPEFLYAWFACFKIGAVAVPINPALKPDEIHYILENSDSKVAITEKTLEELAVKAGRDCPKLTHIVSVGAEISCEAIAFDSFIRSKPDSSPEGNVRPLDEACIVYTSGTTGKPKGAVLTHANYMADTESVVKWTKITPEDRFMCILPLFHVNGQVVTTLSPLLAGGSMVLQRRFSATQFFEWVDTYRPSAFSAVPTIYAMLLNTPGAEKYNLSSLRFCICGAAPMPVEVFNKFEEKFHAKILEGYGLSEGTCASSVNPVDGTRKVGSIGMPLPVNEMRIVDEGDRPVSDGHIGEIAVKGPNVMKEYYKNPQATAQTIKDGWLHTGDSGYRDGDGFFYIVGRKKEMIIRGGENIYPKEIEEVLYQHPKILEAAAVGVPDKIYGEEVKAYVVLKEGQSAAAEEILSYCKQKLADYKCPKSLEFMQSLPKTATGKIQKHLIGTS